MTFGTTGSDLLATTFDGQILHGLGGNDTLTSTHNFTTLLGGNKNDQLTTTLVLAAGTAVPATVTQNGGFGDDTLIATVDSGSNYGADQTVVRMYGGQGDDQGTAEITGSAGFTPTNTATILVEDMQGDNTFSATLSVYAQQTGVVKFATGSGADTLDVITSGTQSAAIRMVSGAGKDSLTVNSGNSSGADDYIGDIVLFAGAGDDTVKSVSWSNSNNGLGEHVHLVDGGTGNDDLHVDIQPSGQDGFVDANVKILGGSGQDSLSFSLMKGNLGAYSSRVAVEMQGGIGADVINSVTEIYSPGNYGDTVKNDLSGGAGNDQISAFVGDLYAYTASDLVIENKLSGGTGSDVLYGGIEASSGYLTPLAAGRNLLYGGDGNDHITAVGGATNVLDGGKGADTINGSEFADNIIGGAGKDVITAGSGDDTLSGGTSGDTFVFSVAGNGTNTITDWNRTFDKLDLDLVDGNGNDLVDEIDAAAVITDDGTDVTVAFAAGTTLIFAGDGDGTITSIGDIVSDPGGQLL